MPKISIVTPCFEAEKYVAATMESIRSQTLTDWEYIVVDDGSNDQSVRCISEVAATDDRISLVAQENAGVAAARAAGFRAADRSSDYLVFLDADDLLAPTFLSRLSEYLDDHVEVGLAYCSQIDIDQDGELLGDAVFKPRFVRDGRRIREVGPTTAETPLDALVSRFEAIPSTCMFRRSTFERVAGWRKSGVTEDKDIGIQMALEAPVHFVAEHLTFYRHHENQRHLDRFYSSMADLHTRWWNDETLSSQHRFQVERALSFDRRVAAHLSRHDAWQLARKSDFAAAARVALRSVKQNVQWMSLELRRRLRRGGTDDDSDPTYDIEYVGFVTGEGGDAVQMLLLADGMQRLGYTVRMVVPASPTTIGFAKRAAELGVQCDRSDLLRADATGPHQNLRAMIKLARSLEAPVIHFHTGNSCLPRSLMIALAVTRSPRAFVTVHSPYETITPSSGRARWWAVTSRLFLHAVISPSDHASAFQHRCGVGPAQVVTVRNAINTTTIAAGTGARIRAELELTEDAPLIVFTSRIDGQKRPSDAVRIFAAIADEFPRAILAFVGSGTETDTVTEVAASLGLSERVKLVGFRTDVADWLAASTVWLLPTERENFSVAVLEALAAGCAVLTTRCPGNDEVIVDDENALAFGVGDIEEGTADLRRLLNAPDLRTRLAAAGRTSAQKFTVEAMVGHYHAVYEQFTSTLRANGTGGR